MELRVLRYFEAVARLGSATAASGELHVAQPSISRQLQQLERELRVDLFSRHGHALSLTPAGRRFHEVAKDLLVRADRARAFATAPDETDDSALRLVCLPETLEHFVAPMIADGVIGLSSVRTAEGDELFGELTDGRADVCVGIRRPPAGIERALLYRVHVTVQIPPAADPWAPLAPITLQDLAAVPFLLLGPEFASRRLVEAAAERDGVRLEPDGEAGATRVAQALAARRGIACVIGDEAPVFGLNAHRLHAQHGCIDLPLYACWERGHYREPAIRALAAAMRGAAGQQLSHSGVCAATPEPGERPSGGPEAESGG